MGPMPLVVSKAAWLERGTDGAKIWDLVEKKKEKKSFLSFDSFDGIPVLNEELLRVMSP